MQEFTAIQPDAARLESAGFSHASTLPIVMAEGGTQYAEDPNEFLYERCLGYWPPKPSGQDPPVTPKSQVTYAYALCDFLSYAAARRIRVDEAEYVMHIYGRYQSEMLTGMWSRTGRPLAPVTVNARVDRACEYLAWLAYKGRRQEFLVPTEDLKVRFDEHRSSRSITRVVQHRKGRAREHSNSLQLPTDEQIGRWLVDVEQRHNQTVGLAFELILQTAIRKAELVGWRIDTIPPDDAHWNIANPTAAPEDQLIKVWILYGTKGPCYGFDHGDKVGPKREILVPLTLARKLNEYRTRARRRALGFLKHQYRGSALEERMADPHLFLEEGSGVPVSYNRVTNCWRNVNALPFKGWSPHGGRHWWACMKLWRHLKFAEADLKARGQKAGYSLVALATDIIRLEIQDQLGHLDTETTYLYIRWVARQLSIALPIRYADYMQSGSSSS